LRAWPVKFPQSLPKTIQAPDYFRKNIIKITGSDQQARNVRGRAFIQHLFNSSLMVKKILVVDNEEYIGAVLSVSLMEKLG